MRKALWRVSIALAVSLSMLVGIRPASAGRLMPRIAFADLGAINVVAPDGSRYQRLAAGWPFWPSWSPEDEVAYSTFTSYSGVLHAWNPKTNRHRIVLTLPGAIINDVAWSPTGSLIAFSAYMAWPAGLACWCSVSASANIFVVHPDGSGLRPVTLDPAGDWSPSWAPDGRRITFLSNRGGVTGVYVADPGTIEVAKRVTPLDESAGGYPVWAPNGRTISYSATPLGELASELEGGRAPTLAFVSPDGTHHRRLSVRTWDKPSWSPDSSFLAVADGRGIGKVRVRDTRFYRLTTNASDLQPAWSTDGSQIAFIRWEAAVPGGVIALVTPNGHNAHVLLLGDARVQAQPFLVWSRS